MSDLRSRSCYRWMNLAKSARAGAVWRLCSLHNKNIHTTDCEVRKFLSLRVLALPGVAAPRPKGAGMPSASPSANPILDESDDRRGLSTADIVFFVLAGVAPMGVVVAVLTVSIARGTGAGVPGSYVVAGAILALFSAGYIRMSRRVTNVGGFYTFADLGLGRRAAAPPR